MPVGIALFQVQVDALCFMIPVPPLRLDLLLQVEFHIESNVCGIILRLLNSTGLLNLCISLLLIHMRDVI